MKSLISSLPLICFCLVACTPPSKTVNDSKTQADASSSQLSCVQSVCGVGAQDVSNRLSDSEIARFQKESESLVRQLAALEVEGLQILSEASKSLTTEIKPELLTDDKRVFLNFIFVTSQTIDKIDDCLVRDQKGRYQVKQEIFDRVFSDIASERREWYLEVWRSMLGSDKGSQAMNLQKLNFDLVFGQFPADQRLERVKALAGYIKTSTENVRERMGRLILKQGREMEVLSKAARGEDLSQIEKDIFFGQMVYFFFYEEILNGSSRDVILKKTLTTDEIDRTLKIRSYYSNLSEKMESQSQRQSLIQASIKNCLVQERSALLSAPTQAEVQSAMAATEKIRGTMETVLQRYLTGDELQTALSSVRSAYYVAPNDRATIWSRHLGVLKTTLTNETQNLSLRKAALSNAEDRADLILLMINSMNSNGQSPLTDTDSICNRLSPLPPKDMALSLAGGIRMSWQTAVWPKFGVGVVAHELAHVALGKIPNPQQIQSAGFKRALKCVNDKHAIAQSTNAAVPYDDEDMADVIGTSVVRELQGSGNLACLFTEKDRSSNHLKNSDASDPHSSDFFRLLNLQPSLGPIPNGCKASAGITDERFYQSCSL